MTAYTRPPSPTRDQIVHMMRRAGWGRRNLARVTHVAESTVDQWLARDGLARAPSPMPPGLYELALIRAREEEARDRMPGT